MPIEITNVVIDQVNLGFEDHGIFGLNVSMKGSAWAQGTGWYDLRRAEVAKMLADLLRTVGVQELRELEGKHVRIRREDGMIQAVGNFLEDRWWAPGDYYSKRGLDRDAAEAGKDL